jgi:hypothetical protein
MPSRGRAPRRWFSALFASAAALACSTAATTTWAGGHHDPGDGYRLVAAQTTQVAPHLRRTATTVQVGQDPINRFSMYHVEGDHSSCGGNRGTLFLLPPISLGFQNYEITADGDYTKSFVAYFASRGYDVWGMGLRTEGLVAGSCESGAVDCSAMADWGIQSLIDDATFVREQIEDSHPGRKPAVGGVSLGSILAVALINAYPHDYAGALLQEGTVYNADPSERAIAQSFCSLFEGEIAGGIYYDGQQLGGLKAIAGLATAAPQAPSPIPSFAGLTNHQAFVAAMSTPGIGPIPPRPNYYFLEGDATQDRFFNADDALARANIAGFVDYLALRTVRDLDCGMAGESTFWSNLGKYHGAVFVNAGGHGFGRTMLDTVSLMPKAHATVNFVADFGHMDHFFATDHVALTEEPILEWLETDVFGR